MLGSIPFIGIDPNNGVFKHYVKVEHAFLIILAPLCGVFIRA